MGSGGFAPSSLLEHAKVHIKGIRAVLRMRTETIAGVCRSPGPVSTSLDETDATFSCGREWEYARPKLRDGSILPADAYMMDA